MKIVRVELGDRSYEIRIGRAAPIGLSLDSRPGRRVLVVSDTHVDPLYGAACERQLRERGADVTRAVLPAGEESKDLRHLAMVYDHAMRAGLDRHSVVVALGGGVVGDLAGFAAATLFRGVRLIQVPTTLLAMVDSSVGGKTAVNLPQGKNLVGAFYQPVEVAADLDTLGSLPDREYVSGLAEVVKYGIIRDAVLFARLEQSADALLARKPEVLETVVARCCELKAEVVGADERESGPRALLNFGHTLAHAIEQVAGYGAWLHGEAVAAGMVYAAELSVRTGRLPRADADRIRLLLERFRLPVRAATAPALPWAKIRAAMSGDKKSAGGVPAFVLAEAIGRAAFGCRVDEAVLEEVFAG